MKISKADLDAVRTGIAKGMQGFRVVGVRKSAGDPGDVTVVSEPKVCFSKYLRGGLYGDWSHAETEQRVFKALGENFGTTGGFLVPPEVSTEIIELLKPKAVVRSMPGVRSVPMTSNKLEMGRVNSGPVVSWGGENTAIAEDTNMTFGQVILQLKKAVCLYKASRELIRDASAGVDGIIKQELADAMALAEDLAFLEGTGGTQPLGLYYHPLVLNTSLSAAATFDTFSDAAYQVEANSGQVTGWISHPRLKNCLRKLKDANGNYLYMDGRTLVGGQIEMPNILGATAGFSTQVPTTGRSGTGESYCVGGQWSNFFIGEKEGIRIETTDTGGDAFINDQVWIKAVREVDCALRHPETFVRIAGITV